MKLMPSDTRVFLAKLRTATWMTDLDVTWRSGNVIFGAEPGVAAAIAPGSNRILGIVSFRTRCTLRMMLSQTRSSVIFVDSRLKKVS
jgi:hypothetical protein